ncbi:MAG: acetate--CoA ligase [Schleiferiaceae bacterium]|nr:acetate--CoA ligase [Schleiferiaceae bacterium]
MPYPYQVQTASDYEAAYARATENPDAFWAEIAATFRWKKPWKSVLKWEFDTPSVRWFEEGVLNISENALDRHVEAHPDRVAILWEPNDPMEASIQWTYKELLERVEACGHALKARGLRKGDRVCIYMGMVPELAVAVLACARIGAVHSVIFGGFSAESIADRVIDASARAVITCDGAFRGGKTISLKSVVDEALTRCPTVHTVLVYQRTQEEVTMQTGRDVWWHESVKNVGHLAAEAMDSEDPLFILYTSGSTGKPKGVVHSCGGYMVWATYTFVNVFQYQPGQIHFCTADIGWITGHSYIVYGPLCAGGTTLMFEGIPTYPDAGRFWQITEKHAVDILYTAPTAIRSLMAAGTEFPDSYSMSSLKVLGTVGEPINTEAWHWYDRHVGKGRIPIVDTWWQTETGGVMISNLAGVTAAKPTYATRPLPGIQPLLVDEHGKEIHGNGVSGNLCIGFPWPGMIRTTYGDHARCRQAYFTTYPGRYFTGDGCIRDEEGLYRITGRVDDVLNVSGHRIGTAEVENAINMHPQVLESAIVGYPHDIKGQGIYAYVILQGIEKASLRAEILAEVVKHIGPIAKPDKIQFVAGLPKTRSGKIMRRLLRKIAEGELEQLGDTTTLLDPAVVEGIIAGRTI